MAQSLFELLGLVGPPPDLAPGQDAPFLPPANTWEGAAADPLKTLANLIMGAVDPWNQPKGLNTGSIGGMLGAALPLVKVGRAVKGLAAEAEAASRNATLRGYHGSGSRLDVLRGDRAGVAYIAETPDIARDYAGSNGFMHSVRTPRGTPLDLGENPYGFSKLKSAVTSEPAMAAVEQHARPDADGVRHGVYAALRDPVVIDDLRASGYDVVRFADDHGPTSKPIVWALLNPSKANVSALPDVPSLRESRKHVVNAFKDRASMTEFPNR